MYYDDCEFGYQLITAVRRKIIDDLICSLLSMSLSEHSHQLGE